jgi:hypothetical protein
LKMHVLLEGEQTRNCNELNTEWIHCVEP